MKNIVLLSDGTGNSAAKRHKTNVWRLYRALDLDDPDKQVAFYDDGVGTHEFIPFRLLGGVFGYGLSQNVVELYMALCRTYKRGDNIYLFGFSRGAFTVRMLAGLIACRGVLTGLNSGDDLRRTAQQQFDAYRSRYKRGYVHRVWRKLGGKTRSSPPNENLETDIEFIGAWDTVDAYGFPVYELASLWDRLIWPLQFVNQRLSRRVRRACHALAIDEERASFRPLLWDESGVAEDHEEQKRINLFSFFSFVLKKKWDKKKKPPCFESEEDGGNENEPSIEQVWFPGVHSDVGGGYPRSELALVTLDWMMSRVESRSKYDSGLRFISDIREGYRNRANCHGVQHDSRAGIRAYYRYKPRDIEGLCHDQGIEFAKSVHRSALLRIQKGIAAYAPTALPEKYEVVGSVNGTLERCKSYCKKKMNEALHFIFLRRWLYAAFVGATLTFAFLPLFLSGSSADGCVGWTCLAGLPLRAVACLLPDCFQPWIEGWIAVVENPFGLVAIIVTAVILVCLKRRWFSATRRSAMAAWAYCKNGESQDGTQKDEG